VAQILPARAAQRPLQYQQASARARRMVRPQKSHCVGAVFIVVAMQHGSTAPQLSAAGQERIARNFSRLYICDLRRMDLLCTCACAADMFAIRQTTFECRGLHRSFARACSFSSFAAARAESECGMRLLCCDQVTFR
jgi:hypothetical protein